MLLSVIIPVYNAEATIGTCLDGLCREIGDDPKVEVICVDDGSTDESARIISSYKNVRLVRQANGGVASARNAGLAVARGEYVAWVDGDDEVLPGWFTTIREGLATSPDILSFDSRWMWSDHEERRGLGGEARKMDSRRFLLEVLRGLRIECHLWMHVIRRTLFLGLSFDSSYDGLEDHMLFPEVVSRAQNIQYVPKALYRYKIRRGSYTQGGHATELMQTRGIDLRDARKWEERLGGAAGRAVASWQCTVMYARLWQRRKTNVGVGSKADRAEEAALRRLAWTACCDGGLPVRWKLRLIVAALNLWWLRRL